MILSIDGYEGLWLEAFGGYLMFLQSDSHLSSSLANVFFGFIAANTVYDVRLVHLCNQFFNIRYNSWYYQEGGSATLIHRGLRNQAVILQLLFTECWRNVCQ